MNLERRVVITGVGLISSLGNGMAELADSLRTGRSGIRALPEWKDLGLKTWIAGHLDTENEIESSGLSRRQLDTMGVASAYCALAAEDAIEDAGFESDQLRSPRFGCIVGTGVASLKTICVAGEQLASGKARRIRPHAILQAMSSSPAAHLAQAFSVGGRSYSISSACATSTNTIGHAFELIRVGALDGALAGGGEEISGLIAAGFGALRNALSTAFNEQPTRASRPFDAEREGFVLGGGAGIVILEELESARERGAHLYGEVLGYASNTDSFDVILPDPDGVPAAECMAMSLRDAGLEPSQVDYINAHGTGTVAGDISEARAIARLFGERSGPLVSSTKSLGGHALGAAGVHEVLHCLAMLEGGFLAGSANVERLDPEVAEISVLQETVSRTTRVHLTNSFGFGGTNACLALGTGET